MPRKKTKKQQFPTVSEVRLQRKITLDQQRKIRTKKRARNPKQVFYHAEDFVKQNRAKSRSKTYEKKVHGTLKKIQERNSNHSRLIFVILAQRRAFGLSSEAGRILDGWRLRQSGYGVFLSAGPKTFALLKKVEPYVTYGEPSVPTIRQLIQKRGLGKSNGKKVQLTDNKIVEDYFREKGLEDGAICCVEDLVHEISTKGPHFKEVTAFLEPFQVSKKLRHRHSLRRFTAGGTRGDRGNRINNLIEVNIG